MLVSDVLRYWYGLEVPNAPRRFKNLLISTADAFSMPLLLRTLLVPWRRDIVAPSGRALQDRWQAFWYNLVSIVIGFFVRLFVLLIASVAIAGMIFVGAIVFLLWLILPFLPIILFFMGIVMLFKMIQP